MPWNDCPSLDPSDPSVFEALTDAGVGVRTVGSMVQCWDVGDGQAQAIVAGYDPAPRARAEAVARVQVERRLRGEAVLDPDPAARFDALWLGLAITHMRATGQTVTPALAAMEAQLVAQSALGLALVAAAAAIGARIAAMTADEARAFDPADAPEWPAP